MATLLILLAVAVAPAHGHATATSSSAARTVIVPRTVGLLLPAARAKLRKAGLRVSVRRVRSLQAVATVVSSRPVAGRRVARGSLVRIAVSRGPGP